MATAITPIGQHILGFLAEHESRLLALVVAVRKALGPYQCVKGDLSETVRTALKSLVAAGAVVDIDGMFSLKRPK